MGSVVMFRSMILAGLACASALKIGVAPHGGARSGAISMASDIVGTAASLQGPEIFWGSEGVELGHEESEIKGYDNFGKFVAALKDAGLDKTLSGAGPYTVFAPSDQAFEDFQGTVTADILKYHVVEGKIIGRHLRRPQDPPGRLPQVWPPLPQDLPRRRHGRQQVGGPLEVAELAVRRGVLERRHPLD